MDRAGRVGPGRIPRRRTGAPIRWPDRARRDHRRHHGRLQGRRLDGGVVDRAGRVGPGRIPRRRMEAPTPSPDLAVASTDRGITARVKGGDSMEVWWIAPDGSVQAAYHDGGWAPTRSPDLAPPRPPAASPRVFKGGDSMEVWWVTPDGSVTGAFHECATGRPTRWRALAVHRPPVGSRRRTARALGGSSCGSGGPTRPARRIRPSSTSPGWWLRSGPAQTRPAPPSACSSTPRPRPPSGPAPTARWSMHFRPRSPCRRTSHGGRGLRGTVWLTLRADGSSGGRAM